MDELIELGRVENMKEFCHRLDYLPQSLSQIRKGKRDITIELLSKVFFEFHGNPVFILLGYGPKIVEENTMPVIPKNDVDKARPIELQKLVDKLEELVQTKSELILELRAEIARLKAEIKSKAEESN
ncbi:hypothetical protein SAMN05660236_0847 [Ohtaekwangia koreensis]|uniref:HTH cro/C1-type domain-containing protein n=2 Tax=Ohtaekwangia koreensis TaxID=688867 RepID=A0A1T5J788_9BACT|nr:hypothetical protein SAMN05660236_0847 [Ohtaekwangia koreensis]